MSRPVIIEGRVCDEKVKILLHPVAIAPNVYINEKVSPHGFKLITHNMCSITHNTLVILASIHQFNHKTAEGLCSLRFEKSLKTICVRYFTQQSFLSLNDYNTAVEKTLEDLHDHFDILADQGYFSKDYDSTLTDGVLTIKLADNSIYVINKQTPNRQLWLSSPESGPKRYDFVDNSWVYSHDPTDTMHEFLSKELQMLFKREITLSHLSYAKRS